MLIPNFIEVYGDLDFRGDCPKEDLELSTFFNQIRKKYPDTLALTCFHVKNEGKKSFAQAQADKMHGSTAGVCDIVVVGSPTLLIEMKRRDHTKSKWQPKQIDFLKAAHESGCKTVLALGYQGALQAVEDWLK